MTCHMFPAGTGTSSRIVTEIPDGTGQKYTIRALTQTNYKHTNDMQIAGVPIGKLLLKEGTLTMPTKDPVRAKEGSLGGKADDGSIVVILM